MRCFGLDLSFWLVNFFLFFRYWRAQGDKKVVSQTLLKNLNMVYRSVGFNTHISGKSAKALGVSLAFESGMSDEQVRILGRWASIQTARHYFNISSGTLLSIGKKLTNATMGMGLTTSVPLQRPDLTRAEIAQAVVANNMTEEVIRLESQSEVKSVSQAITLSNNKIPGLSSNIVTNVIKGNGLNKGVERQMKQEKVKINKQVIHILTLSKPVFNNNLKLDKQGFPVVEVFPKYLIKGENNLDCSSAKFTIKTDF